MRKISQVFGLRTSRNPQNRQISHYRYAWGQSRLVILDDLWKVKGQMWSCADLNHVNISITVNGSKLVAENTTSLKNRSEAVPTSYDVRASWADLTWSKKCQNLRKGCPMSYAKFQRYPFSGSEVISENSWGVALTPLHGRGLKVMKVLCWYCHQTAKLIHLFGRIVNLASQSHTYIGKWRFAI